MRSPDMPQSCKVSLTRMSQGVAVVSSTSIALLGAVAGFTIYLGLPVGRLNNLSIRVRALLNAMATGVLLFLLMEVFHGSAEWVDEAVEKAADGGGSWGSVVGHGAMFTACFSLGLVGLVYYDRWMNAVRKRRQFHLGPGAASVGEFAAPVGIAALTPARMLALLIATGIGLHNFAEGLAIGNSAASGQISFAILLIVGFGLHNATEGFGIVGPLAGEKPSWRFLAVLGFIGGAPTFVGTLVGQSFTSEIMSTAFLALAAGSILYVVIELLAVSRNLGHKTLVTWGLVGGAMLGLSTDWVLVAAGA